MGLRHDKEWLFTLARQMPKPALSEEAESTAQPKAELPSPQIPPKRELSWQDACAAGGLLIGLATFLEIPNPLRTGLLCVSAVLLFVGFAFHTGWPIWFRVMLSSLVPGVVLLAAYYVAIAKPEHVPTIGEITTAVKSSKESRIVVERVEAVYDTTENTHAREFYFNVYYRNSGDVAASHLVHSASFIPIRAFLTPEQQGQIQDQMQKDVEGLVGEDRAELESAPSDMFFTVPPDNDPRAIQLVSDADASLKARETIYLFATFRYRDSALPPDKVRITEFCGYFRGSFDFWHNCDRDRTFVIDWPRSAQP